MCTWLEAERVLIFFFWWEKKDSKHRKFFFSCVAKHEWKTTTLNNIVNGIKFVMLLRIAPSKIVPDWGVVSKYGFELMNEWTKKNAVQIKFYISLEINVEWFYLLTEEKWIAEQLKDDDLQINAWAINLPALFFRSETCTIKNKFLTNELCLKSQLIAFLDGNNRRTLSLFHSDMFVAFIRHWLWNALNG